MEGNSSMELLQYNLYDPSGGRSPSDDVRSGRQFLGIRQEMPLHQNAQGTQVQVVRSRDIANRPILEQHLDAVRPCCRRGCQCGRGSRSGRPLRAETEGVLHGGDALGNVILVERFIPQLNLEQAALRDAAAQTSTKSGWSCHALMQHITSLSSMAQNAASTSGSAANRPRSSP